MRADWVQWMAAHAKSFTDKGAGVGKTKKVTAGGTSETKNEIMLYGMIEAESHQAAAKMFEGHPHLGIPKSSIEIMETQPLGM